MIRDPNILQRYTPAERVNHWVVAICFVLLALSGLALFHPVFWTLTALFGGGVWTRILHPYIGVLIMLSFIGLYFRFRADNLMTAADRGWLRRIKDVIRGDEHNVPDQGKFNAGQKLIFKLSALLIVLLFLSGLAMWRTYYTLPVELIRAAVVVHAASAALMIILITVHIYAAIWVKGSFGAMGFGVVSRAWARQHHRSWYRQLTGK